MYGFKGFTVIGARRGDRFSSWFRATASDLSVAVLGFIRGCGICLANVTKREFMKEMAMSIEFSAAEQYVLIV